MTDVHSGSSGYYIYNITHRSEEMPCYDTQRYILWRCCTLSCCVLCVGEASPCMIAMAYNNADAYDLAGLWLGGPLVSKRVGLGHVILRHSVRAPSAISLAISLLLLWPGSRR